MRRSADQQLRAKIVRIRALLEDLLDLDAVFSTTRAVVMRGRPRVPMMDFQTAAGGRLAAAGYDYHIDVADAPGLTAERVLLNIRLQAIETAFPWLNLLLFGLTVLVVQLTLGTAFMAWFLAILLFHEFGHFFAARYHGMDTSWPYFIPAPLFFFGTLGAVIRIREPFRDRRSLFDMAVAGPIAGFVISVIAIFVGLHLSTVTTNIPDGAMYFGDSLLFKLASAIIFPNLPPNGDILLHPIGFAGWAGLLVTMLNLLPMGQLDGGHIAYAMFGRYQRYIGFVVLAGLAVASYFWLGWLLWVFIGLIMKPQHPPTLVDELPIGPGRRLLGWFAFAIFIVSFIPVPITF